MGHNQESCEEVIHVYLHVFASIMVSSFSQALQFVGLEHPQSTQEHQEHVQRSIVVAKMEQRVKRLKNTEALDCDKSLVEAIVPHETGKDKYMHVFVYRGKYE